MAKMSAARQNWPGCRGDNMARQRNTTFSNSHAAVNENLYGTDANLILTNQSLLAGDPGSATLYAVGNALDGTTFLPSGSSGQVAVNTDIYNDTQTTTTALGATVTIGTGGTVTIDATAIHATIDDLAAGATVTDSFVYAIKMADGTVSQATANITWTGEAANVVVDGLADDPTNPFATQDGADPKYASTNGYVVADVNGGVDPVHATLTDNVMIDAFAASGNATGFTIVASGDALGPSGANLGSLSALTGSGHVDLTYSVTDDAIYATHLGYGEHTTDNFELTTTNGTVLDFYETVYGNIHAAVFDAGNTQSVSINEGESVALNILAADHDDNANLTYTISGLAPDAYLTDTADGTTQISGSSVNLTAAQLAGLTLHTGDEMTGTLTITVTNTEYGTTSDSTDPFYNTTAHLDTSYNIALSINDAPLSPGNGADLSATQGVDTGIVALVTFTDAYVGDHTSDFSGTINWGDGTTTNFTSADVSYDSGTGNYTVYGDHTYQAVGSFDIAVQVQDDGGSSTEVDGSASVSSSDVEGPVTITFAMDFAQLGHLADANTNQSQLNASTAMGALTASGDADDTFTYMLGSGSDGSGHTFDTTHFVLSSSGALLSGASPVGANTYYLNIVATDSDTPTDSSSQEFIVYVGDGIGNNVSFSSATSPVIAYGVAGADTLTGSSTQPSFIAGGAAADSLSISDGTVVGNSGADTLNHVGGAGSVDFAYLAAGDSNQSAHDTINGFLSGNDHIDFSAISGLTSSASITTASSAPTSLAANSIVIVAAGGGLDVYANAGNNTETISSSSAHDILEIHLNSVSSLNASDFTFHA
jgi:hypothetical protein